MRTIDRRDADNAGGSGGYGVLSDWDSCISLNTQGNWKIGL